MSEESQTPQPVPGPEARQWAMFATSQPSTAWFSLWQSLGPLIVWQIGRIDPFVGFTGNPEALNFQISVALKAALLCSC
jgi:uncharacterized Tic20 family protein